MPRKRRGGARPLHTPSPRAKRATRAAKKRTKGTRKKRELTQSQRTKLRKQTRQVAAFFVEAGIAASLKQDGYLYVNGKRAIRVDRPFKHFEWSGLIDKLAVAKCSHEFIEAIDHNGHVFGKQIRAYYARRDHGFELRREDESLALVRASEARVYGGGKVKGNFLTSGPHWLALSDRIAKREREEAQRASRAASDKLRPPTRASAAKPTPPARRMITFSNAPKELSAEIVEACLDASRRIRLERRVAFAHSVVLQSPLGELAFAPIAGPTDHLRAPFCLTHNGAKVAGEIVLSRQADPLLVKIEAKNSPAFQATAWAAALLGFADATCFEVEAASQERRPKSRHSGRVRSRRLRDDRTRSVPARRMAWPSHLEPIGRWAPYSGSFVAGHRRRLKDGWSPSREAQERARRIGIMLLPNETWVQPHARGLPEGMEMRFRWRAPHILEQQLKGLASARKHVQK